RDQPDDVLIDALGGIFHLDLGVPAVFIGPHVLHGLDGLAVYALADLDCIADLFSHFKPFPRSPADHPFAASGHRPQARPLRNASRPELPSSDRSRRGSHHPPSPARFPWRSGPSLAGPCRKNRPSLPKRQIRPGPSASPASLRAIPASEATMYSAGDGPRAPGM